MDISEFTDEEMQDCIDTFQFLDTNKNNRIELSELCSGIHKLGLNLTNLEIRALITQFGRERKDSLSFKEYQCFYKDFLMSHETSREEAIKMFNESDLNKDGFLDKHDLKLLLIHRGSVLSENEVHVLLRDYDYNRDSRLSLTEFIDSIF